LFSQTEQRVNTLQEVKEVKEVKNSINTSLSEQKIPTPDSEILGRLFL